MANPTDWPAEPPSPQAIDLQRFSRALRELCDRYVDLPSDSRHAEWILRHAAAFEVDPFVLAALIFRRSRCDTRAEEAGNIGLGGIDLRAHKPFARAGKYRYWIRSADTWRPRALDVSHFSFDSESLLRPEANIFFTAALLAAYGEQCPHLDAALGGAAHRHPVAHFVWGDVVRGTFAEDEILEDRRRLLRLYSGTAPPAIARFRGVSLHSPLDGAPRAVSSRFREVRAGGRRHGGIDFFSTWGEPVRATADGLVVFAGYQSQLRRRGTARTVSPKAARRISRSRMGIGGLFVLVRHSAHLTTGYFHLSRYTVSRGMRVRGGQLIGYVGRTGIISSRAHLHFELRIRGRNIDPARALRPYLIGPNKRRRRRPVALGLPRKGGRVQGAFCSRGVLRGRGEGCVTPS